MAWLFIAALVIVPLCKPAPHRATAPRHTLRDLARRGRTP
jgi:hypothetical protein